MSIQYLDFIDRFLASELETDLGVNALAACNSLSGDQLTFFAQQLEAVDANQHDEMVRVEPRQIVLQAEAASDRAWTTDDDIRPTSAMFTHPYNKLAPFAVEHLKRQLLFFSRVAILAPMLEYGGDLAEKRRKLAAFLEHCIELRPLIADGSVILLPRKGFYSNEIEGGAALVRRACIEEPALLQWLSSHQPMLDDFAGGARKHDPFFDAGIRICSAIAYGHTLAATHPFVGHLYKLLVADKGRVDRGRIAAIQNIDNIDLPGLAGLQWNDVFSVRRDETCLRTWRAHLAVAISSVDPNLPAEEFVERFDSQVQAQLERAAVELDGDLKRSSSMARFKKGGTNLAISAVAATARIALGGPMAMWDAILKVAQGDGPKEALRFMWESREATAKRALRSHYAVFSSTSE